MTKLMLTMVLKYIYVFLLAFFGTASSNKLIYSSVDTVTAVYGSSAEISFTTNFTGTKNALKFTFVEILKPEKTTIASGTPGTLSASADATIIFGSRLSAYSIQNTGYTMKIHKVKYSDQYTFRASASYRKPSGDDLFTATFSVKLLVKGGPTNCGNQLIPKTYISLEGPANISFSMCGNPEPSVSWSLNNTALSKQRSTVPYTNSNTLVGKSNYTYSVILSKVKTYMCGMKLSYSATGFTGEVLKGETQLHFSFQPNVTLKYSYRLNSSCIRTEWIPIDVGTCTIQYQIQYMNASGNAINTATVKNDTSQFDYCPQGGYDKINYTRIRGSFIGYIGKWTTKDKVSLTTPMPSVTPSVVPVVAKSKKDKVTIPAIIGGVIGGILLIIIIAIIIYCCCCRGKKKQSRNTVTVNSDSLGFKYKKNSKKKDKHAKGNGITVIDNQSAGNAPTLYATVQKDKKEMTYFDPDEFGLEPTDVVPNDHSTWKNDEGSTQQPTFLI